MKSLAGSNRIWCYLLPILRSVSPIQQPRVFLNVNNGQSACINTSSQYWGKDSHLFTVRCYQSGARWRSWLRHYATSLKVAGSIPDGVTGNFYWHNLSGCTMALGSTQLLTEMNTRNISWGKSSRCIGLTTLPPSCADCLKIWEREPPGTLRTCPGLQWDCCTFLLPVGSHNTCPGRHGWQGYEVRFPADAFDGVIGYLQLLAGK